MDSINAQDTSLDPNNHQIMRNESSLNKEFIKLSIEQDNLRSSQEQNIENDAIYSNQNASMKLRKLKDDNNNDVDFPVIALLPIYFFAGFGCVLMGISIVKLLCKYKYREGKAKLVCKKYSDNICKSRVPRHKKPNSLLNQAKDNGQVSQPNMEIMNLAIIVNQAYQLNEIQLMSQQILQNNQIMLQPYNLNGVQYPALNISSMPPNLQLQFQNNDMNLQNQSIIGVPVSHFQQQQVQGLTQIQNFNSNFANPNEVLIPQNLVNDQQNKSNQQNIIAPQNGFQTNFNNLSQNYATNSQAQNNINQDQNTQHQPLQQLYGQPILMISSNILIDPQIINQEAYRQVNQQNFQNHPAQIQPDQKL
eukprot:403337555